MTKLRPFVEKMEYFLIKSVLIFFNLIIKVVNKICSRLVHDKAKTIYNNINF